MQESEHEAAEKPRRHRWGGVIGFCDANAEWWSSLDREGRFHFDLRDDRTAGYYHWFEPSFAALEDPQAPIGYTAAVHLVASGARLELALVALEDLEERLYLCQPMWRFHWGSHRPGPADSLDRIEPLLSRARALSIAARLRAIVTQAMDSGSGVALCVGKYYEPACSHRRSRR
jgi:hypothetical protein